MSDTPLSDAAASDWAASANLAADLERRLAAVTAERDALRKEAEYLMQYFDSGNGVPIERATIRRDDPVIERMRAALRKEGA